MTGAVKIYWNDLNWELFSFIPKAFDIVGVYGAQVTDRTKETALMAPRREFEYDAIICKGFLIITIHLKIWGKSISVQFDTAFCLITG